MNPFLERHWGDVHVNLISYIRDALAERLPLDITPRGEEHVSLYGSEGERKGFLRPDVAVVKPPGFDLPAGWQPKSAHNIVVAEPQPIPVPEDTERWVEIRTLAGRLITVLEVLSPHKPGFTILAPIFACRCVRRMKT